MNAMDFDDLLVRAVNVLELFPEVRDRYCDARSATSSSTSTRTRTTPSTAGSSCSPASTATSRWSATTRSRSTASAAPTSRNILDFEDAFPDAKVIKLEQNYRSTQTILDAANAVIAHNREQKPKDLWTDLGDGDKIKVRELDDEHAEARYVVGEIERLVDEGARRARSRSSTGPTRSRGVLEDTLVRREIGYQVVGGTKFYDRAEIKDAIAYLTVLGNPQDVISFTRIANSPKRGIGQTSLRPRARPRRSDGHHRLGRGRRPGGVPGLGTAAVRAFTRFMETMNALRERAEQERAGRRPARGGAATRPATSTRWRPSARSRRRAAWRTSRSSSRSRASSTRPPSRRRTRSTSSSSRSRSSPTPTRAATTTAS